MRAVILGDVSTLRETMSDIYEELMAVHAAFFCLHILQQQNKEFVKTVRNVQIAPQPCKMDNVIKRGITYFCKENEATRRAREIKSLNIDLEKQGARLIHCKHSGLMCTVVQCFGFHYENPQNPVS